MGIFVLRRDSEISRFNFLIKYYDGFGTIVVGSRIIFHLNIRDTDVPNILKNFLCLQYGDPFTIYRNYKKGNFFHCKLTFAHFGNHFAVRITKYAENGDIYCDGSTLSLEEIHKICKALDAINY